MNSGWADGNDVGNGWHGKQLRRRSPRGKTRNRSGRLRFRGLKSAREDALLFGFGLRRSCLGGGVFALHVSFSAFAFLDLVGLLSHKNMLVERLFLTSGGAE